MTTAQPRRSLPSDTETELLHLSRRRCCLCFGLLGDLGVKKGQIAHLDRDPSNNEVDNLAFLCLDHHDEYDSRTSQSKGLKRKELLIYRASLYSAVREFLDPRDPSTREEPPLASTGELDYYLTTFATALSEGRRLLSRISAGNQDVIDDLIAANATASKDIVFGVTSKAGQRHYHTQLAKTLSAFADSLTSDAEELSVAATRMLDALSRAAAVASDIEFAEASMFDTKIDEILDYRKALSDVAQSALKTVESVRALPRGTTKFNRGRRLAIASLEAFDETVQSQLKDVERHECNLRKAKSLL